PANLDRDVAAIDPTKLAHALHESGEPLTVGQRRARAKVPDHRHLPRLLRPRRKRPHYCAAEQRDELAAPDHSITSSASARSVGGISTLSAFAVLRLITNSNLVACITGRSAGFSPLRTRPV